MKTNIFTRFNLSAAVVAFALLLGGCDTLVEDVSSANSKNLTDESLNKGKLELSITPNGAEVGSEVTVEASMKGNDPGTIFLQEKIGGIWTNVEENPYIFETQAEDNGRIFRAYENKRNGNNFYSLPMTLTVLGDCGEFTLIPNTSQTTTPTDNVYTFTTTYVVRTCDRAVNGIKLQGGLTAGAILDEANTSLGFSKKVNGKGDKQNTVITWNVGNMEANTTKTFIVVYTQKVACGTEKTITGAWSAKGVFADDSTPALAGYDNQQSYTAMSCN